MASKTKTVTMKIHEDGSISMRSTGGFDLRKLAGLLPPVPAAEIERLEGFVELIKGKISAVHTQNMSYDELRATHIRVMQEVVAETGAKFRAGVSDAYTLRLAGVSSSCTSGQLGLLQNWCNAAVRRIETLKGEAA